MQDVFYFYISKHVHTHLRVYYMTTDRIKMLTPLVILHLKNFIPEDHFTDFKYFEFLKYAVAYYLFILVAKLSQG